MSYYQKYLKYKNKYLSLVKLYQQRGNGENFSWFLNETELNQQEEDELEEKYNNGNVDVITFRGIDYTVENAYYINGGNKLIRQQKILIIPDEALLFEELKNCAEKIGVTLRVAGGWVRDKIIGLPNDDIDIAIDIMSGKDFSEHLFVYINSLGNGWVCHKPAIIAANAAKSKNLETATLKLRLPNGLEFELDFVGLRSEVYDEHSRVPIIKEATPPEDAGRRDLTINSLFYNINTGLVEDYMGGVRDIKRKVIRTPLDPMKTFSEDPLRMLRALRFLARFQFNLDDGIRRTMQNRALQSLLATKVSKERIGKEIEGFFKGSSVPFLAFREIHENRLWNAIFGGDSDWGNESIELLGRLEDKTEITVLSALTLPLANMDKRSPPVTRKDPTRVQNFYLVNLKLRKILLEISETIHRCIFSALNLSPDIKSWRRSEIALIKFDAGDYFINALNIIKAINPNIYTNILQFVEIHKINNEEIEQIKKKFNGDKVIQGFKVEPKSLGSLLKKLLIWNIDNPSGTFEEALSLKAEFL